MKITLRTFEQEDIPSIRQWALDINAEQYQSRIFPRAFNGRDLSGLGGLCAWYIIQADGQDAGTVWLEKEDPKEGTVILGIMLGNEKYFGKGIGREAVNLAVSQAKSIFGFHSVVLTVRVNNPRAIASYKRCGFIVTREDVREYEDGRRIPYYAMQLDL